MNWKIHPKVKKCQLYVDINKNDENFDSESDSNDELMNCQKNLEFMKNNSQTAYLNWL